MFKIRGETRESKEQPTESLKGWLPLIEAAPVYEPGLLDEFDGVVLDQEQVEQILANLSLPWNIKLQEANEFDPDDTPRKVFSRVITLKTPQSDHARRLYFNFDDSDGSGDPFLGAIFNKSSLECSGQLYTDHFVLKVEVPYAPTTLGDITRAYLAEQRLAQTGCLPPQESRFAEAA